jgi:hypothetical protein
MLKHTHAHAAAQASDVTQTSRAARANFVWNITFYKNEWPMFRFKIVTILQ